MRYIVVLSLMFLAYPVSSFGWMNPYITSVANESSGGGAVTYILEETFETPTTGYDDPNWTEYEPGTSSIDPTYSTAITGSQSVYLDYNSDQVPLLTNALIVNPTESWGSFTFSVNSVDGDEIFYLRDSSAGIYRVRINIQGSTGAVVASCGSVVGVNSVPITISTDYRAWWHYDSVGGLLEVSVTNLASARPSTPDISIATCDNTGPYNWVRFSGGAPTNNGRVVDDVYISEEEFTDIP